MEAFKRLENEDENAYIWRVCDNKDLIGTWQDVCNLLYSKGLYKIDNFKSHNYIYIPFVVEDGEVAIEISNYDNILGELLLYEQPLEYKRCAVCGTVIKKTRSPKKYCTNCAYKENIRKTKENKRSLKTQSS